MIDVPVPTPMAAPRLLLVDDDADHVQLMTLVLHDAFPSARIASVGSCTEARGVDPAEFDLALVDVNLPDGTGIELVKEWTAACDTPAVLVTGERFAEPAVEGIRAGASDYLVKHGDYLKVLPIVVQKTLALSQIKCENRRLNNELLSRNHELECLNAALRQMAARDPLTGLYNRRHFNELFQQLFAESDRYGAELTCMMMDLDGFKQINDRYGHQMGDRLLVLTAESITSALRTSDVIARYGGDEFVALLPHTAPDEARQSAKRIRSLFRQNLFARVPDARHTTLSIGLASREQHQPQTREALLRLADDALYQAKAGGKDRITVVRPMTIDS